MKKSFSIIIPAYNVAPYLERCLQSCVEQDIPEDDYEMIIVNDGSKDNTLAIAQAFAEKHPSVKIISQENKGLSAARNTGMSAAEGDYIWFVDSDDTISSCCLGRFYERLINTCADVLAICVATIKDGIVTPHQYYGSGSVGLIISGPQMLHREMLKAACAPFFIYRRSFLFENGFQFYPGVYHEDEEWTPRVLYNASTVVFTDSICYNVYSRPGSIMSTPNPKRSLDLLTVAESLHGFSETVPEEDRVLFSKRITGVINHALKLSLKYSQDDISRFQDELNRHSYLLDHFKKCGAPMFIIEGYLLSLIPKKSVMVYRHLQRLVTVLGLSQKTQGRGN